MAVSGCRPSHYPFVKLLATKYDPTPKSLHLGKPRVLVSTLVCQLKPLTPVEASGCSVVQFRSEALRRRWSVASGPLDAAGDEELLLDLGRVSGMHRGW